MLVFILYSMIFCIFFFFFSSRRRHTRCSRDWSSDVCSSDLAGPLIDAHSHLPNAGAIDAYVEAMKQHNVTRVVLLGVGGVQKDDADWIAAAARKYPDRVIAGLPVPDPTSDVASQRLGPDLDRRRPRVLRA